MNKKTFEEIIENDGVLIYRIEGDSMAPFIRQGKDLVVIEKAGRKLKKYDVPLYKRDNGQYVLHRMIRAVMSFVVRFFLYSQLYYTDKVVYQKNKKNRHIVLLYAFLLLFNGLFDRIDLTELSLLS